MVTNLTFEPLAVNQVIKGFRSSTILANQKFQILANQKFQSTQQVTYRGVTSHSKETADLHLLSNERVGSGHETTCK